MDVAFIKIQIVKVRACESAIAHVRAVIQVRKGCEASWNGACEVRVGVLLECKHRCIFFFSKLLKNNSSKCKKPTQRLEVH